MTPATPPDLPTKRPLSHARGRGWRGLALGILLSATAWAGDKPAPKPPEFRQVAPLASVREAANAAHFSLKGLAPAAAREKLKAGDAVTTLVTWTEGKKLKQWIIELEAAELTEGEKKRGEDSIRFYTSSGHEFTLGGGQAALKVRMIGPLEQGDAGKRKATAPAIEQRRILVSADFLGLGLEQRPVIALRRKAVREANPKAKDVDGSIRNRQPFSAAEIAATQKQMAEADPGLVLNEAEERAFIGSTMAMSEFFRTARRTPGLKDVLQSVLEIPWWSIGTSGEMNLNLKALPLERELSAASWGLPEGQKVYAFPCRLDINGKPVLIFQLAVTSPQPPLTASAGAVGFAAGAADGTGPVLTFQVVSTRAAP